MTLRADAGDNVAVAGVRFFVNGSAVGQEDPAAPYEVDWATVMVPNGKYVITAVARDASGNTASSER